MLLIIVFYNTGTIIVLHLKVNGLEDLLIHVALIASAFMFACYM